MTEYLIDVLSKIEMPLSLLAFAGVVGMLLVISSKIDNAPSEIKEFVKNNKKQTKILTGVWILSVAFWLFVPSSRFLTDGLDLYYKTNYYEMSDKKHKCEMEMIDLKYSAEEQCKSATKDFIE